MDSDDPDRPPALPPRAEGVGGAVAAGAVLMVGARFVLRFLSIFSLAILARLLTPADYGLIALALVVLGLLEVLTNLELTSALIRKPGITAAEYDTAFTLSALRGTLSAAVVAGLALPYAAFTGEVGVAAVLVWLALVPLIDGLRNPRFVRFEKALSYRREITVLFAARVGGAAATVGFAFLWRDHWALVAGALVERSIWCAMTYVFVPQRPGLSLSAWREFVAFGGWLTGAGIVNFLNYKADTLIIGRELGTATLGQYNMGDQMATMATNQLAAPLSRTIYSGLASLAHDRARLTAAYYKAQAGVLAVVLPIGLGSALAAHEIVVVVAGPPWLAAVPVVQFIAPVIAVGLMTSGVQAIVMVEGQTRTLFWRSLFLLGIRLPAIVLGIWALGLMGVIYARVFSSLVQTGVNLEIARRLTGGGFFTPFRAAWRSLVAGGALAGAMLAAGAALPAAPLGFAAALTGLGVKLGAGGLAYGVVHLGLWQAAGRPDGVERKLGDLVRRIIRRRGPR